MSLDTGTVKKESMNDAIERIFGDQINMRQKEAVDRDEELNVTYN